MGNNDPPKMSPEPPPQMRGETEAEYQAALARQQAREALIHYAETGQTTDLGGHVDHGPEEPNVNEGTRPPATETEITD
jgi:hypothetical protein